MLKSKKFRIFLISFISLILLVGITVLIVNAIVIGTTAKNVIIAPPNAHYEAVIVLGVRAASVIVNAPHAASLTVRARLVVSRVMENVAPVANVRMTIVRVVMAIAPAMRVTVRVKRVLAPIVVPVAIVRISAVNSLSLWMQNCAFCPTRRIWA
jgi:hypothetical protein